MSQKWIALRVVVWLGVLAWVVYMLRTPGPGPAATAELPPPTPRPVAIGSDPAQVLSSVQAVEKAPCATSGTLHVRVGAEGLERAWIAPAPEDAECLTKTVWAQAWPALSSPMELEWPIVSPSTTAP